MIYTRSFVFYSIRKKLTLNFGDDKNMRGNYNVGCWDHKLMTVGCKWNEKKGMLEKIYKKKVNHQTK